MPCLGDACYLSLHAIPVQLSIQASSISKSILAATQQMNTVPGKPCEAALQLRIWNETTGGEDQVSIQTEEREELFPSLYTSSVGGIWKNYSSFLSAKN